MLVDKINSLFPSLSAAKYFNLELSQWLALFVLLLTSLLLSRIVRYFVSSKIVTFLKSKNVPLSNTQHKSFAYPFGVITAGCIWTWGVSYLSLTQKTYSLLAKAGEIVLILGFVSLLYHMVKISTYYFTAKARTTESKFDDILIPLLSKTAFVLIWCFGALLVCQSFDIDVTGLIAGLGIGGLAFALAAKDTISNIFGSLTVVLDKPFEIGDWVNIGGKVEGTVEQVGFRSTRVRTFYDSLISVPNNTLTNTHIDNYGKRKYRRLNTKIAITYDTPAEKIEAFCEAIRQLIANHKWTRKDYFHVYLNNMGDSALEIILYVFWNAPDWSRELNEKHRLLLDILRIGNELGVEFAFPTQTLHVIQSNQNDHEQLPDNFFQEGKNTAQRLVNKPLTTKNPRSGAELIKTEDELSL